MNDKDIYLILTYLMLLLALVVFQLLYACYGNYLCFEASFMNDEEFSLLRYPS